MRLASSRCSVGVLVLLLGAGGWARGQALETGSVSAPGTTAPRGAGLTGVLSGVNVTTTFAAVHDSSIGWYSVLSPGVSYSFSPRVSAEASVAIYPYRLVEHESATTGMLAPATGDMGDTLVAVHGNFAPRGVLNTTTFAVTLPTGNQADGLGLGRATMDLSNHSERYFGRKGMVLDMGFGDSAGLFNRLVRNQDNTLAPIAHFQVGTITPLPWRAYLQTTAYEQLPLGDQKLYGLEKMRYGPPVRVVIGRKVNEDNGFASVLSVPVTSHVVFSSYYTRSLRLHLDTVSVGVTYSWKSLGRPRLSMIDKALAEAERGPQ